MGITTAQIRGARGILNWSQSDLASRTGISATSIGSIENGLSTPRESTLNTIKKAFENGGIEFIGQEGMRQKAGNVRTFTGREGYLEFFKDVHNTLLKTGGEVLVSNVDEREFAKWHGEFGDEHLSKVQHIEDVSYKILVKEGDTYFPAKYAQYRWLPKDLFYSVPFYLYGQKLAIILFEDEPTIILIDYPAVAEAYRHQFNGIWGQAIVPEGGEVSKQAAT